MTVTIYSATFGGYDVPRAPVGQDIDVRWLMFTDAADLNAPEPWEVVRQVPNPERHPRMAAKWYKMSPHEVALSRYSIWIDANMEITSPSFAREALACLHDGIAVFRHPHRDCIYEEARASLRLARWKYRTQPLLRQVAHYRMRYEHPEHGGLYACGVLARDDADEMVHRLDAQWWHECERWTYQDQLSFPVVLRTLKLVPGIFPLPLVTPGLLGNDWLTIHDHLSKL